MRNTTERRQAILELMCERRHETISNLAFEFEVSERTMRYDVQILSISYPIYPATGNRNQGGGVHVVDGYYIGRKIMKPSQVALLERLAMNLDDEDKEMMKSIIKDFTFKKPE